jgi:hypothetical protein
MGIDQTRPPLWPEANAELEAAIGRAVIAWSVLEREIDSALELVLRTDIELAKCITSNLGTKARLDIFRSSVHTLWHGDTVEEQDGTSASYVKSLQSWIETENTFVQEADRLASDTERMAGELRNWVAHGQPFLLHVSEDEHHWMWGRFSARKGGVKGKISKMLPHPFDEAASEIRTLVERWHTLRSKLSRRADVLNDIDRAMCTE